MGDLSIAHLLIYSIIYVFQVILVFSIYFILYALGYNLILLNLLLTLYQLRPIGSLSVDSCVSFICSHQCAAFYLLLFLSTSLLSGCKDTLGYVLYIFCPRPRISYFCKWLWFLLLEYGIRNQDLGTEWAHCYWSPLFLGPVG